MSITSGGQHFWVVILEEYPIFNNGNIHCTSVDWGRVPNQIRVAREMLVIKPRTSKTALTGV